MGVVALDGGEGPIAGIWVEGEAGVEFQGERDGAGGEAVDEEAGADFGDVGNEADGAEDAEDFILARAFGEDGDAKRICFPEGIDGEIDLAGFSGGEVGLIENELATAARRDEVGDRDGAGGDVGVLDGEGDRLRGVIDDATVDLLGVKADGVIRLHSACSLR